MEGLRWWEGRDGSPLGSALILTPGQDRWLVLALLDKMLDLHTTEGI